MYVKNLNKIFLLGFFMVSFVFIQAQVTTSPTFPNADEEVIITFDATDTNLKGYTGNVYAHTGVTTDNGQWQYTIGDWGDNDTQPALTRSDTDNDIYTLTITPSINEYYGVSDGETVSELSFVFRSSDGDTQTSDLSVDVYEDTLNVQISSPDNNLLLDAGTEITISVSAENADNLYLYIDDELINTTDQDSLEETITAENSGKHWIWAKATEGQSAAYDSVYYYVKDDINTADLPDGVIKGINYIDESTVTLVLYAPEKQFVYVIGDFNDWDISEDATNSSNGTWMMNRTSDGNNYWITINNLVAKQEYGFQYWINDSIVVADPYTDKILDPDNDPDISSDTYPDLKDYPEGKTTELVSVFQTDQDKYEWKNTDFSAPDVNDMVIYEMHIRDFVATHCYQTIIDTLDYIDRLGINVLELMPINEFEGNSSWGYNPSFYFAPDKYYGTKDDLKELVDSCHQRGIAVVMDMVLNHSYGQSPFLRMYYDEDSDAPTENSPWYNVSSPNTTYYWGYDFNHESEDTQELVDSITTYWLTQYNMDGFRFDFTKGFTNTEGDGYDYDASRIAILERMYDHIKSVKSDAYVICEHLTDNSEETVLANYGLLLWGNMNYNYNEATMGWNDNSDFSWISYLERSWDENNLIGYMESHDEERLMYKNITYGNESDDGTYSVQDTTTALERIELAANFFLTVPGPKMIWQFGELGYDYSIDYNERTGEKPIVWDYADNAERAELYNVFKTLINIKQKYSVFETSDFTVDVTDALKSIHLNSDDMDVTILGNFDVESGKIDPEFQETGTWYEFYSGDTLEVTDVDDEITLEAGEYRLYTTQSIGTYVSTISEAEEDSTDEDSPDETNTNVFIYPNPASDIIYFKNLEDTEEVIISNTAGQRVMKITSPETNSVDVSGLKKGMYILTYVDEIGNRKSGRFVKN